MPCMIDNFNQKANKNIQVAPNPRSKCRHLLLFVSRSRVTFNKRARETKITLFSEIYKLIFISFKLIWYLFYLNLRFFILFNQYWQISKPIRHFYRYNLLRISKRYFLFSRGEWVPTNVDNAIIGSVDHYNISSTKSNWEE